MPISVIILNLLDPKFGPACFLVTAKKLARVPQLGLPTVLMRPIPLHHYSPQFSFRRGLLSSTHILDGHSVLLPGFEKGYPLLMPLLLLNALVSHVLEKYFH